MAGAAGGAGTGRVVVVGGGFGGIATAARLAKLGHQVTLVEAGAALGGALGTLTRGDFSWDTGPTSVVLPAVVRDLFRKTGRPLERELELVPVEPMRRHVFDDGDRMMRRPRTVLDLPGGSRAAQLQAIDEAFARAPADTSRRSSRRSGKRSTKSPGEQWATYVDDFAEVWEALRLDVFEHAWSPERARKETQAVLRSRTTLLRYATQELADERLVTLALHPARADGQDPRDVPAWVGMWAYLEQTFGSWTVPGGMGRLTEVLTERLATRGVEVRTGEPVRDLRVEHGRVTGVLTDQGSLDADTVVCAVDPRRLPALAAYVERTMPAMPAVLCHLGLRGPVPELPREVVVHGDPLLVLDTGGRAPEGKAAWTVRARGRIDEDVVTTLVRAGIDVRDQVETRVDLTPLDLVQQWGGSPLGVLWQGQRTFERTLGPATPVEGVWLAGSHARTGAGLPFVGLSAALVAEEIGPAAR